MNVRLPVLLLMTATFLASAQGVPLADVPVAHPQLVVAVQQEPATLDPVIATLAVEVDAFNLIFDGLFRRNAAGALIPDLAQRVPTQANGDISRDGRAITYHLVTTAHWQDGPPVTSRDVRFTWQAIMNPANNAVNRVGYDQITRIDTPDAATVIVHLKRPWSPIVETIFTDSQQGAIVPAHLLAGAATLNRSDFNTHPVGSGPYRFAAWQRGNDMRFEANSDYFRGAPKIPRIVWRFIPEESSIANGLRSGEIDLTDGFGPVSYAQLGKIPGLEAALGPSLIWEHLTFNTAHGPLTDVRLRQALCLGMDVRELYAKVVHGLGLLGVGLENTNSPWYLKSLQPCRFDPVAAGKLLDAAGWPLGADGMRAKDGKPLQITFGTVAGIADRAQTQVLLQSRWKQLGIDTIVRTYPPATFFAPQPDGGILDSGKTDVALSANYINSLDPEQSNFLSADRIPPAGSNSAYWRNARVTALERSGSTTYDPVARRKAYDEIQRIVARELPYETIRWWEDIAPHKAGLHGVEPPLVGSTFWNVERWVF